MSQQSVQLRHPKLHEAVARHIEAAIVEGRYAVGSVLPSEKDLAEQMGVGLSTIRYAIRILSARGLVEVRQGIGAIVTQDGRQSFSDMLDLLLRRNSYDYSQVAEFRRLVEPGAAYGAAEKASAEDLRVMREALDRFYEAAERRDFEEARRWHAEFHVAVVSSAGNLVLTDFLVPMLRAVAQRIILMTDDPGRMVAQREIHDDIYAAIASGSAEEAQSLVRVHIDALDAQIGQVRKIAASISQHAKGTSKTGR